MKNKELDFDIKIGLNKVEENISNLTDKERERVISDLENGMGPDDIMLYMNQFRGNDKNLDYVTDMVKKGVSVSAAVRITKKYCSDNTIDAVLTCMENGMPIATIEKEYSRKSFVSRMMSYMEAVRDFRVNKENGNYDDYDEGSEYSSEEKDLSMGSDIIMFLKHLNRDFIVQASKGMTDKEGAILIPFVNDPYEANMENALRAGVKMIFDQIPTVESVNIYIGASDKMMDELLELSTRIPKDKITEYDKEELLNDE